MNNRSLSRHHYTSFPNSKWRNLLSTICKEIDSSNHGYDVISPFGFEVFEDPIFLTCTIRRLYCYIGIPSTFKESIDINAISQQFSNKLLSRLDEADLNKNDIVIVVNQDQFNLLKSKNYKCKKSDRLLDVQIRYVDSTILEDYAKYIICTLDSICNNKDEPKQFLYNKRHRNRTYQIYVMLEKIFEDYLPKKTTSQTLMFNDIFKNIENSIQMFYSDSELYIDASTHEKQIFASLIKPRVALIRKNIATPSENDSIITVTCNAYHVSDTLSVDINKKIYHSVIQKICSTYLSYY